jgi:hypothetical protein
MNIGAGIERDMMGVKSGTIDSAEFGVTDAVVVEIQHEVETRDGVIIGMGSMLIDLGTEATGPLTISVSEVLGHGGMGEGE